MNTNTISSILTYDVHLHCVSIERNSIQNTSLDSRPLVSREDFSFNSSEMIQDIVVTRPISSPVSTEDYQMSSWLYLLVSGVLEVNFVQFLEVRSGER